MENNDGVHSKSSEERAHWRNLKPLYYLDQTVTFQKELYDFRQKLFPKTLQTLDVILVKYNGAFSAASAIIMIFFTYYLVKYSHDQTSILSNQLKSVQLDERPWISVQGLPMPADPLFASGNTFFFSTYIAIKNVGKSPAREVNVTGKIYSHSVNPLEKQKAACSTLRNEEPLAAGSSRLQFTMFPGDAYNRIVDYNSSGNILEKDKDGLNFVGFVIVGCVDYKFFGDETHHDTSFIFDVRKTSAPFVVSEGQRISAQDLSYSFSLAGTGEVD